MRASSSRRGALPGRNPGMRTSRAIFRNAASSAFSNSRSSTSTESLTLFPSRGSTLVFIRGPQCTGARYVPRPVSTLDPDRLLLLQLKVWGYKQGELVAMLVHLGDRLGLYRAMAGRGPMTAAALASATGLHERWVLEWLRGQAAAELVESDDGELFSLSAEGAAVLVDEDSLAFAAGAFGPPLPTEVVDKLADAFRTGVGVTYEGQGAAAAHSLDRMLAPWARLALVPIVLPALDGVVERLRRGAVVADVGCGGGAALVAMAEAFPASTFHGYDPSRHAV